MGKAQALRPVLSAAAGVLEGVAAALLSPPCAACGRVVSRAGSGALCAGCWAGVDTEARFDRWPAPPPAVDAAASLGRYEGTLRLAIHALKYDARRSIAKGLARRLVDRCGGLLEDADAVVPVPLHPFRRWARGFNQSEELGRHLGMPLWRAVRRVRHTPPQASLPAGRRLDNLRLAFAPRARGCARRVAGSRLVLLDDVSTTGATVHACAEVLRRMGAKEIRVLTVARTPRLRLDE